MEALLAVKEKFYNKTNNVYGKYEMTKKTDHI